MKAIVYEGPGKMICKEMPIPEVPEGWGLVKVSYSGICGTDFNINAGTHPRAKPPVIIGHEFSGVMAEDAEGFPKGTYVTVYPLLYCGECKQCKEGNVHKCNTLKLLGVDCDGAMAEYAVVPLDRIYKLPETISKKAGAFIEPLAVTVHAVRETEFRPGDNALVFGCGAIGISTALTLRNFGATYVVMIETNKKRADFARSMGFEVLNPIEVSVVDAIKEMTDGNGFDWVFDCAGVQPVASLLFDTVKPKGDVVIVAAYHKPVELDLVVALCKEINMKFIHVYRPKDFDIAIKLASVDNNYEKIVTHVFKPEDVGDAFNLLLEKGTSAEKVVFKFD